MLHEKNKRRRVELVPLEEDTELDDADELGLASLRLNEESKKLLTQLIEEPDSTKATDLTDLFNINQNKKTLVRIEKLSGLQDDLVDQFTKRIQQRPDEISNKELMDGIKVVQDIIERGSKQVQAVDNTPLIQINQQTNSLHVGESTQTSLSRESRERVKSAVFSLLKNIDAETEQDAVISTDFEDVTQTTEQREVE